MTPGGVPIVKPRELVRTLEKLGFLLLRKSKGSHWQFAHPDGRRTTIPMHQNKDIGPGLMRKILRDIEIDPEELRELI